MNAKEIKLAAAFLEMAADAFSNNGCNDWSWPEDWTLEERRQFAKEYHDFNGDPEEFNPSATHYFIADFAAMGFLAHKLSTL